MLVWEVNIQEETQHAGSLQILDLDSSLLWYIYLEKMLGDAIADDFQH